MNNAVLGKQLNLLQKKMIDPSIDWVDVAAFREKETGIKENPDTIRKGFKILSEYLSNGWVLSHPQLEGVKSTVLCLSDLHVPFELPLSVFADYANKIDVLVLNGDLLDCTSLSSFPKIGRSNVVDEIIKLREYLISLIELINPNCITATKGNHEMRLDAYLAKAFNGGEVQELMPHSLLDYIFETGFYHYDKNLGTKTFYSPLPDIYPDKDFTYENSWYTQVGDILFVHPKSFSSGILKTSEKAVQYFRNEGFIFNNLVMAHTHRSGMYKLGKTVMIEQGCCCDISRMNYHDALMINSQKEGYVVFYLDEDNKAIQSKTEIINLN